MISLQVLRLLLFGLCIVKRCHGCLSYRTVAVEHVVGRLSERKTAFDFKSEYDKSGRKAAAVEDRDIGKTARSGEEKFQGGLQAWPWRQ